MRGFYPLKRQQGNHTLMNEQMNLPTNPHENLQLAMVYSPVQTYEALYSPEEALERGTLFQKLDKPLTEVAR